MSQNPLRHGAFYAKRAVLYNKEGASKMVHCVMLTLSRLLWLIRSICNREEEMHQMSTQFAHQQHGGSLLQGEMSANSTVDDDGFTYQVTVKGKGFSYFYMNSSFLVHRLDCNRYTDENTRLHRTHCIGKVNVLFLLRMVFFVAKSSPQFLARCARKTHRLRAFFGILCALGLLLKS